MTTKFVHRLRRRSFGWLALSALAATFAGCGGGGSGSGSEPLTGVVLVDFLQSGQDNVPLNRTLEFIFSSPIDPSSVGPASIQIREGPTYGLASDGDYIVQGSTVYFEPNLPSACDLSDAGFQPNTAYRVTIIGSPEEFSIRNLAGDALQATVSAAFSTRLDTDPDLFEDQIPGVLPTVTATSPADGTPSVAVSPANAIEIVFSENLNPCTVNENTVLLYQYATGDIVDGFVPPTDSAPGDDFSWGSGNATLPPRRVRANFSLQQNVLTTVLTLTPVFGEFPDNALIVCQLTNQMKDFGGNPLVPFTFSFTTENRPAQVKSRVFEFNGDVPVDTNASSAEVNTARAPGRAQGFLLVAGDGDNGAIVNSPSGPDTALGPPGCTAPYYQVNDGSPDDFDPTTDVNLNTGATLNTCKNSTDGSTAVTFEYRSFRIRSGVTVRVVGVNPAIVKVRGDVNIEPGARLLVRGDGQNGAPQSTGSKGVTQTFTTLPAGGVGVAGGGSGGFANNSSANTVIYGGNGYAGFGSDDFGKPAGMGGSTDPILDGQGRGAVGTRWTAYPPGGNDHAAPSAGGGGHGKAGADGVDNYGSQNYWTNMDPNRDGKGGTTYGDLSGSMPTPEAGSGGGGGGTQLPFPYTTSNYYAATGGAGGAGGGFIDLTASGNITISGELNADGGAGGAASSAYYAFYGGGGGGGGGSGGGIRLLTPGNISLAPGSTLTADGGNGGAGAKPYVATVPANPGGKGGVGRLVLEDSDGVIAGMGAATIVPAESLNVPGVEVVFYRGTFDASRFKGGGIRPVLVTDLIDVGPASPTYVVPSQDYGALPGAVPPAPRIDFIAGIPTVASRGIDTTAMYLEVQGFPGNADGTPNLNQPSGWKSVGYFKDSGSEPLPAWVANQAPPPADVAYAGGVLPGNTGVGIGQIDGRQFMQFRVTFYLPTTMGVFDGGPYLDRWTLWYSYDQ